jgi:hypothetical protein
LPKRFGGASMADVAEYFSRIVKRWSTRSHHSIAGDPKATSRRRGLDDEALQGEVVMHLHRTENFELAMGVAKKFARRACLVSLFLLKVLG